MPKKIFLQSIDPKQPAVNINQISGVEKRAGGATFSIHFMYAGASSVIWSFPDQPTRDSEYTRVMAIEECCPTGGGGGGGEPAVLTEYVEVFENLISGNTLTSVNYTAGDVMMVFRNGTLDRQTLDYTLSGSVITFGLPFGSSNGTLANGETVTIIILRNQ